METPQGDKWVSGREAIPLGMLVLISSLLYALTFLNQTAWDFSAYYSATSVWLHGGDPYDSNSNLVPDVPGTTRFVYSPLVLLIFAPFAFLDFWMAAHVLFFMNLIMLGLSFGLVMKKLSIGEALPRQEIGILAIIWIFFFPVRYSLHMGQVNLLVLLCF
ncbi:MAG: glycosyltransferase family 87 protein, partial [Candidatus Hodarchaeales archaeon]